MLASRLRQRALLHARAVQCLGRRWFNLHEYQSKAILRQHGVAVENYFVARSSEQCARQLNEFSPSEYVVKAQVLAGGRGKGTFANGFRGGVHLADNRAEVVEFAGKMLGQRLVTRQTQSGGLAVNEVMVSERLHIAREMYLVIVLSREDTAPVMIASAAGGMDVETMAAQHPELMHKEVIDINTGLTSSQVDRLTAALDFKPGSGACAAAAEQIRKLFETFMAVEATQIEINPLVETEQVLCVDAKVSYDDAAGFRQRDIFAQQDNAAMHPNELTAQKLVMKYIKLDGDIACLVNGAGLAMAVMDMIKVHGGEPANFMDVGGRVDAERVMQAVHLVAEEPSVNSVLVNIFGGIVNCKLIAQGIVSAFRDKPPNVPIVVRLEGTEAPRARKILQEAHLPLLFTADDLDEVAKVAVVAGDIFKKLNK